MSFKSMIVLLDNSEDSSAQLDVACSLAEDQGAHLNALALSLQIYPAVAGLDAGAAAIDVGQIEENQRYRDLSTPEIFLR